MTPADGASSATASRDRLVRRAAAPRRTPPAHRGAGRRGIERAVEAITAELGKMSKPVKQIRAQIDDTTSDYDREKLQERLAKLVGGVAIIKVGAATETEMKEKKAAAAARCCVPRRRSSD